MAKEDLDCEGWKKKIEGGMFYYNPVKLVCQAFQWLFYPLRALIRWLNNEKKLIIVQVTCDRSMCSHEDGALYLYSYFIYAEEEFRRKIERQRQEPTGVAWELEIGPLDSLTLTITKDRQRSVPMVSKRNVTYQQLHSYGGAKLLGSDEGSTIELDLDCRCNDEPCQRSKQIWIQNIKEEQIVEQFDARLPCECNKAQGDEGHTQFQSNQQAQNREVNNHYHYTMNCISGEQRLWTL